MKRIALPLAAALLAGLASCTSDNSSTTTGMSQAQIDSAVNARVDEMRTEMERSNDSLINMMAQAKADSIVAAMKGGSPAPTRPTNGGTRPSTSNSNGGNTTPTPPPPNNNPSNNTRPGSNQGNANPSNNTRPGSNQANDPNKGTNTAPSNNTRPGSNQR